VSYGTIWQRWVRGVSWTWVNERYRARVPDDLADNVMTLESRDRFHAKQGRSTARVVLIRTDPPLAVYLKRHFRLPWPARLAALVDPAGKHSPAAAEWGHLEQARALGIDVPEVVAAGERIGPGAHLQSFVMIAELAGCEAVNELLPRLVEQLDARMFESLKRRVIAELARITATLHVARVFHKDLYLCHFFLDREYVTKERRASFEAGVPTPPTPPFTRGGKEGLPPRAGAVRGNQFDERTLRLSLIDLHRLKEHKFWPDWWRWKDLGQLLYSTYGVAGITDRDRLRFWRMYRRTVGLGRPRWHARMVRIRAARYLEHNRKRR
jgi:heptose I phosphotransferase